MKDSSWIPDWRIPDEYPDPTDTSEYQWTWEFLRRNPIYQEICDKKWSKHKSPPPTEAMSIFDLNIGSSFPHYNQNDPTEKIVDKGQPGILLRPLILNKDVVSILEPKDYEYQDRDGKIITHKLDGYYKAEAYTDSLDIVFPKIDLRISLDQQFKNIKSHLQNRQKKHEYINKRNHPNKFPTYLRVLDAVNDGAHELDIIATVLKLVLDNPKYNAKSRFTEVLKSASRYRDIDFRYISQETYPHISKAEKKKLGI